MDEYFHIEWVIELVKEQQPDRLDIVEQLEKSNIRKWIRQPYIRLASAESPEQFADAIVLDHEHEGTIVLDIFKDGRIGGIEFVSQIR